MPRHRLTDEQWDRIAGLFPARKATGRRPRDRREIMDAICWVLNTGAPWRDLPASYGPWQTAWDLFDKWNNDGLLLTVLQRLQGEVQLDEELWCIDGTVVRAPQVRFGRRQKGDEDEPEDHALGRSRGGLSCKIHFLCDKDGNPLHAHLTAGQTHEAKAFMDAMVGVDEQLLDADGQQVVWPAVPKYAILKQGRAILAEEAGLWAKENPSIRKRIVRQFVKGYRCFRTGR